MELLKHKQFGLAAATLALVGVVSAGLSASDSPSIPPLPVPSLPGSSFAGQLQNIETNVFGPTEAEQGIVIQADEHNLVTCGGNGEFEALGLSILEDPETRFWAYEYTGDEPPFEGRFLISDGEFNAVDLDTAALYDELLEGQGEIIDMVRGETYYIMTERDLSFRCSEGLGHVARLLIEQRPVTGRQIFTEEENVEVLRFETRALDSDVELQQIIFDIHPKTNSTITDARLYVDMNGNGDADTEVPSNVLAFGPNLFMLQDLNIPGSTRPLRLPEQDLLFSIKVNIIGEDSFSELPQDITVSFAYNNDGVFSINEDDEDTLSGVQVDNDACFNADDGTCSIRIVSGPDTHHTVLGEPPPIEFCMSTSECSGDLICSTEIGECLPDPDCEPGGPCPDVCYGICIEEDDVNVCEEEDLPREECGQDYDTEERPFMSVTGDFNEDGVDDIAVTNYVDGTVTVLYAEDAGTGFGPSREFNAGRGVFGIATGDLNDDGHLDLAVTNRGPAAVHVLYGNGEGVFGSPQEITDDISDPNEIAIGDFNGDDIADLVVSAFEGLQYFYFDEDGDEFGGSFINLPDGFNEMVVSHLNDDDQLDIAVNHEPFEGAQGSQVTVQLSLPNGDYDGMTYSSWSAGRPNALDITAADIDHDGDNDLLIGENARIVGQSQEFRISVLLNDGDGDFSTQGEHIAPEKAAGYIVLGHFDDDDFIDLVHSSYNPMSLHIRYGTGPGQFDDVPERIPLEFYPLYPVTGDFNCDDLPDLAFAYGRSDDSMTVLMNDEGSFDAEAMCTGYCDCIEEEVDEDEDADSDDDSDSEDEDVQDDEDEDENADDEGASCSNGEVEGDEECDDDNSANGDGCSSTCEVEIGFSCNDSEPSECSVLIPSLIQAAMDEDEADSDEDADDDGDEEPGEPTTVSGGTGPDGAFQAGDELEIAINGNAFLTSQQSRVDNQNSLWAFLQSLFLNQKVQAQENVHALVSIPLLGVTAVVPLDEELEGIFAFTLTDDHISIIHDESEDGVTLTFNIDLLGLDEDVQPVSGLVRIVPLLADPILELDFRVHELPDGREIIQVRDFLSPIHANFDTRDFNQYSSVYTFTGDPDDYSYTHGVWPDVVVDAHYGDEFPENFIFQDREISLGNTEEGGVRQVRIDGEPLFIFVGDGNGSANGESVAWPLVELIDPLDGCIDEGLENVGTDDDVECYGDCLDTVCVDTDYNGADAYDICNSPDFCGEQEDDFLDGLFDGELDSDGFDFDDFGFDEEGPSCEIADVYGELGLDSNDIDTDSDCALCIDAVCTEGNLSTDDAVNECEQLCENLDADTDEGSGGDFFDGLNDLFDTDGFGDFDDFGF